MANQISAPPWEVLNLISQYLDPKSLALASCVSKTWSISMSSDHLWEPFCSNHFPSLSNLRLADPSVSFRHLYSISRAATLRRLRTLAKPEISLADLIFTVSVFAGEIPILEMSKPCEEILIDPNGVFKFEVGVGYERSPMAEILTEVNVKWNVVLRGWRGVFTMMDCDGKMNFSPGAEGWLSAELPSPGCCSGGGGSGLVADLKLGFGSRRGFGGKIRVEKVGLGILNVVSWRYASVEDGLRYLQLFLLPSDI
ncbi:hypothetical protein UlMin_006136 [Ulmus minor]